VLQDLNAGLSADPAECECSCGDPSDEMLCSAQLRENSSSCINFKMNPNTWDLNAGQCKNISTGDTAFRAVAGDFEANGATCKPTSNENVPDVAWTTHALGCGINNPDECSVDGTCVPDTGAPLCIYVGGDTDCPDGPYETQIVYYGDVTDDRACSECSCGEPTGTCEGAIQLSTGGCNGFLQGSVNIGGCGTAGQAPTQAGYAADIVAECAAAGGQPTGDATASGAVTFCCTQ
jgi:hypothetical protein